VGRWLDEWLDKYSSRIVQEMDIGITANLKAQQY
jgi:hypothetical protein